jgi:hypothetical protein
MRKVEESAYRNKCLRWPIGVCSMDPRWRRRLAGLPPTLFHHPGENAACTESDDDAD